MEFRPECVQKQSTVFLYFSYLTEFFSKCHRTFEADVVQALTQSNDVRQIKLLCEKYIGEIGYTDALRSRRDFKYLGLYCAILSNIFIKKIYLRDFYV